MTDGDPQGRLSELIQLYLLRCDVEGKSQATVRAYRETLERFERIARREGFPEKAEEIEAEHLYIYLGRYTGHSLETRHRYFREVRCFFNWLIHAGYLSESPFRALKNVRLPRRIVRPFSAEDVSTLLEACDSSRPVGVRDRAILMTLLDTGVRCSELAGLDLADLDLVPGRLRVLHGKGNKQRVVPFASHCGQSLVDYLAVRGREPGPLFVAALWNGRLRPGVRLEPNGVKQLMRRLGRATGMAKVHPHRFRHTFATWAIEADARELDVQYLLGHSSPDMVRRYAASYNCEQAARRHVSFSPGNALLATTIDPRSNDGSFPVPAGGS